MVRGIVQGVGFRPWIHQLAVGHGLAGFVLNSTAGVVIEVEGAEDALAGFRVEFTEQPPPLASVDSVVEEVLADAGYAGFEIRESRTGPDAFVLVPPDVGTCVNCFADFEDPENRRFGYPFTNCTHCGPRYTIIRDVPYDRAFTTMAEFPMCGACEAEYRDPASRRFHAEPNACPECGPWVELWDREWRLSERGEAIAATQQLLEQGQIVAIKGLGGFHLACLADDDEAVRLLRVRKRRSDKPFAVMVRDLAAAEELCVLSEVDRAALISPRRPIVIVPARKVSAIAPGLHWIGIMLPYTPLHHLLFAGANYRALVMTSGNLSEEPIASRNEEVAERLHPLASHFLLHNRKIQTRADDSVVRTFEGRERVMRRSRGYAPVPVDLGRSSEQILACGGELKNVFCLTKDHYAVLSQHIGDLENLETLHVFEETLEHMKRFFRIVPVAVAHDLHPGYLSTRYALGLEGVPKIGVQHHHAHVAACMAENHLESPVIGVALDGTGYGTDGKIWGGEFLVCDYSGFERPYHFRYVPLAGGDAAVKEVWRSGLAYARDAGFTPGFGMPRKTLAVVNRMLDNRINTVDTSSCGRLFDAVAAILGIRMKANYEGQAAMELEALANDDEGLYDFDFDGGELDFRVMIRSLADDAEEPAAAAARFHNTLARAIAETCLRIKATTGLNRVCLSGGTFQNVLLLKKAAASLRTAGFELYLHSQVPPNDGGLALGQAVIANAAIQGHFTLFPAI